MLVIVISEHYRLLSGRITITPKLQNENKHHKHTHQMKQSLCVVQQNIRNKITVSLLALQEEVGLIMSGVWLIAHVCTK